MTTAPEPAAPITVALDRAQAEAAVYALRSEAHRQDPDEYPIHSQAFPDYHPYPAESR